MVCVLGVSLESTRGRWNGEATICILAARARNGDVQSAQPWSANTPGNGVQLGTAFSWQAGVAGVESARA